MLQVEKMQFRYAGSDVLSFPDFGVGEGEHCLVLGDSGSGKTTLLHVMGGLLRGYSGRVSIGGTELNGLSEVQLDHFRGQKLGFVFQRNHLVSSLSVEQNLMLVSFVSGIAVSAARMEEVLTTLGLESLRKKNVKELSHGQAQRVAIARAVLNHPAIIMADEPTSALDDTNCDRVIRLLMDAAASQQATLLVATHDKRLRDVIKNQVVLTAKSLVK